MKWVIIPKGGLFFDLEARKMRNAEVEKLVQASVPEQKPWWVDVAIEFQKRAPGFFAALTLLVLADVLVGRENSMLLNAIGAFN